MIIFFIVVISLYSLLNFYIVKRCWQAFEIKSRRNRIIFLAIYIPWTFSYSIAKGLLVKSNSLFYDVLLYCGSFWFAILTYIFLIMIVIDLARIVIQKINYKPKFIYQNYESFKIKAAFFVIMLSLIMVGFGFYNSQQIITTTINISLPKKSSNLGKIKIAFFADSHLSPINNGNFLNKIVSAVNYQKPDLILLAGDIVDDKNNNLNRFSIDKILQQFKTKYGVYTCNGNHEFIVGVEEADNFLDKNHVKVLRDTVIVIDKSLKIISREDRSVERFSENKRLSLKDLMKKNISNLPTILLDHQPLSLQEAVDNKIDLQLSGHTHNGQFLPGNLIVKLIYELPYGYLKLNSTQFYITSGVGTWGPPVKICSDPEVVILQIAFK